MQHEACSMQHETCSTKPLSRRPRPGHEAALTPPTARPRAQAASCAACASTRSRCASTRAPSARRSSRIGRQASDFTTPFLPVPSPGTNRTHFSPSLRTNWTHVSLPVDEARRRVAGARELLYKDLQRARVVCSPPRRPPLTRRRRRRGSEKDAFFLSPSLNHFTFSLALSLSLSLSRSLSLALSLPRPVRTGRTSLPMRPSSARAT